MSNLTSSSSYHGIINRIATVSRRPRLHIRRSRHFKNIRRGRQRHFKNIRRGRQRHLTGGNINSSITTQVTVPSKENIPSKNNLQLKVVANYERARNKKTKRMNNWLRIISNIFSMPIIFVIIILK